MQKKSKNNLDIIVYIMLFIPLFIIQRIGCFNELFNRVVCFFIILYTSLFGIYFVIKEKDCKIFIFGFIFTIYAELCLQIFMYDNEIFRSIGTTSFLLAQISYAVSLSIINKGIFKPFLFIRIILSLIVIFICQIVLKNNNKYLAVVSVIYIINLVINMVQSAYITKKYPFLYIGFAFFILCDILVGISTGYALGIININEGTLLDKILNISNLCWIFYMISQFLIPLSIRLKRY